MQRVKNYGSFLQALSLKNLLEEWGNSVEFIDIKSGQLYKGREYTDRGTKDWSNQEFVNFRKKREEIILEYGKKYLGLQDVQNLNNDYEFAIIGSDEVFNCIGNGNIGFTTQLYGENVSKYTITYAASCGHTTYEQIKENGLDKEVKRALQELRNISVRDKNTLNFVNNILDMNVKNVVENIDPVFIYDFEKYLPNKKIQEKDYIIVYSYDYRLCNDKEVKAIKEFAISNNLKTIGLGLYQPWCDENINVTPFELLNYFKNARYVITDTFHGAVFSIKYNKQFVGISRTSNSYKFEDLLNRFGVMSQKIDEMENLEKVINNKIDYDVINKFIKLETEKSKKYLKNELDNALKEVGK